MIPVNGTTAMASNLRFEQESASKQQDVTNNSQAPARPSSNRRTSEAVSSLEVSKPPWTEVWMVRTVTTSGTSDKAEYYSGVAI